MSEEDPLARAADRLAELTAATGSVHEVLALEVAADIEAINTAAGALSAGAEWT